MAGGTSAFPSHASPVTWNTAVDGHLAFPQTGRGTDSCGAILYQRLPGGLRLLMRNPGLFLLRLRLRNAPPSPLHHDARTWTSESRTSLRMLIGWRFAKYL
jgi:hypothetical protein